MHMSHEVNFSTEVEGLDEATGPEVIRLRDGETHEITIKPVRKRIGDADLRMLGYNGSIPGPTLYVDQGSEPGLFMKLPHLLSSELPTGAGRDVPRLDEGVPL